MFKKLKKIIQIMTDKDISELKEEYSNFSYQWIKGDNLSQTQHFEDLVEDGGRKYIVFSDKTRISLDLLDEYMIKVERGFEEIIATAEVNLLPQLDQSSNRGVKKRDAQEIMSQIKEENPIFTLLSFLYFIIFFSKSFKSSELFSESVA